MGATQKIWRAISNFLLPAKKQKNWKVIVLCVVGATTFWFFNALGKEYTTRIDYPIAFTLKLDSIVIVRPLPAEIQLDVTSGGWDLFRNRLSFNLEPLVIDLEKPLETKFMERSTLLPILAGQLDQMQIKYVVTDTIFFDIEPKTSKYIALTVDSTRIPLAQPYRIVSPIVVRPDSMRITGNKSLIDSLRSPWYISLNIDEVAADFNQTVSLNIGGPNSLLTYAPQAVEVSFQVEPYIFSSYELPIKSAGFPNDSTYRLSQDTAEVSFVIRESYLPRLADSLFTISCNFDNLNRTDSTLFLRVTQSPDFIEQIKINPAQVQVRYGKQP